MKHEQFAGTRGAGQLPVPPRPSGHLVLFADLPDGDGAAARAEADLLLAAHAGGLEVITAGLAAGSPAGIALSCRTPMYRHRARQSLARMGLPQAAAVVVMVDAFRRAEAQSATRFRVLKERARTLALLAEILCLRPDTIAVVSGPGARAYLAAAQALAALRSGRRAAPVCRPLSQLLDGALARGLGLTVPTCDPVERERLLDRAIGTVPQPLTPRMLIDGAADPDQRQEFRLLARIAAAEVLKHHPTLRWLRTAAPGGERIEDGVGCSRMLQAAQAPAPEAHRFRLPISRYMMHLHTVLNLRRAFPMRTRAQAAQFVAWYEKRGCERVPARWVPAAAAPPATADAPDQQPADPAARIAQAVAALLALDGGGAAAIAADTRTYLAAPPAGGGASRLAILLALLCRAPLRRRAGVTVAQSPEIQAWFQETACRLLPAVRPFGPAGPPPPAPAPRLTIQGIASGRTGLGANAAMSLRMARALGVPHVMRDADRPQLPPRTSPAAGPLRPMRRNVVLHHVNADRIPQAILSPDLAWRTGTCHIGFLLWELDRVPAAHRLGLDMLDEIWAPSRFVADLYAGRARAPVHLVGKGLAELPALRRLAATPRSDRRFTALVCFDFHSSVERKNPLAAVQGFQTAFPARRHPDCRLIVKTTPTSAGHWGDPADQMGRIRRIAAADRRITIVERFLPRPALWRMMHAASCILSTHRAEGFGYIPAHALALGRPLVTTDYGGSRDFCDDRSCFPVAAPLVAAPRGHTLHAPRGARWADVAPDAVAAALRRVHDDPDAARRRALHGQARMARDYSMAAYTARCRARLDRIGAL